MAYYLLPLGDLFFPASVSMEPFSLLGVHIFFFANTSFVLLKKKSLDLSSS
jgi:hypothetical protein